MKTKITLSGFAGTGKSTVGKMIQEKLNFEFISIGNYTRNYAKETYGMTINEFCFRINRLQSKVTIFNN